MDKLNDPFFIVGNSRSGTTMMLRILDKHPDVYCLNELHFFEHLWSGNDIDRVVSQHEAAIVFSKLLYIQRMGYIGKTDSRVYLNEATKNLDTNHKKEWKLHEVYEAVMHYETGLNGKSIPCEKTPQNVFYLQEIFSLFPRAKVINMVRDPRAILLSQKRKWLRRKMGASFITPWEVIRLRINYHPITLSRLWNSAILAANKFSDDERMYTVYFEQLLEEPELTAIGICKHLDIPYMQGILDIPQASSSNESDSDQKGIKKTRAGNWRSGGLTAAEIWWCQKISGNLMKVNGYTIDHIHANVFSITCLAISFPIKLMLALLINLNRMKNIVETLKKRLRS